MTMHSNNMSIHQLLVASLSIVFGTGTALAGSRSDAQDQARALLSGVVAAQVDNATSVSSAGVDSDTASRDPQLLAQWLLAGRPRVAGVADSDSAYSVAPMASAVNDGAAGVDALEQARRILAGKGR